MVAQGTARPTVQSNQARGMVAYAGAQAATSLAGALAGLVARVLVPPAVFGAQSLVAGAFKYVAAFNGQFRNAIDREVPLHNARGENGRAWSLSQHAYTLLLIACGIEATAFGLLAWVTDDTWVRYASLAYLVMTFTSSLAAADIIYLKAHRRLDRISRRLILSGTAHFFLVVSLSALIGGVGFFIGIAAGSASLFLLVRGASDRPLRQFWITRLHRATVQHIGRVGALFSLFNLSRQLLGTLDRFFVAATLSLAALGIYSLGATIVQFIQVVPASLAGAYFPSVVEHVTGPGRDASSSQAALIRAHAGTCLASLITGLPVILLLPPLLHLVLPAYQDATVALQIMAAGGVNYASQAVPIQLLAAGGNFGRGLVVTLVSAAAALPGYLLFTDDGLDAVALVTGMAYAIYGIGLLAATKRMVPARALIPWTALSVSVPAGVVSLYALGLDLAGAAAAVVAAIAALGLLRIRVGITPLGIAGHLWSMFQRRT